MEEQKPKNQEEKFLENSGLEHARDVATIMPTMIDDSIDDKEIKRDLSSIIPKYESKESAAGEELISKEVILKSDGAEVLATIDDLGDVTFKANYQLPSQIDIKERKERQAKEKVKKKKKEKLKPSKAAKQQQNIMSLAAILIIAFLIGFYFLYVKAPGEEDFVPLTVTIELGDSLPIRTKAYVRPGVGTEVDELLYVKDVSKVVLEEVGEYQFSIKHNGIVKYGKVVIKDTTAPTLETRTVTITEGDVYKASSFVESCRDHSGCNYAFQDNETTNKYTTPGSYVIYIIATDAYGNSVTKKANLFIEAKGLIKTYVKETSFDFQTGYSITDEYQLNFAEYASYSMLFNGKHIKTMTYQDEAKYQEARKSYNGEPNYECIDHSKQIVFTETVTTVGSNYSKLDDIERYFNEQGYRGK